MQTMRHIKDTRAFRDVMEEKAGASRSARDEQGFITVVVVLLMLVLVTIIGVSAINMTTIESTIVRTDGLYKRNFYVAESAAHEAAQLLENTAMTETNPTGGVPWIVPTGTDLTDMKMVFATAFDAATGNSSFLMDMSSLEGAIDAESDDPFAALASGLLGEMEFRQVGDRMYTKSGFFGLMFGTESEWISMPADEGAEFASGFESAPTDPNEFIGTYEGADAVVNVRFMPSQVMAGAAEMLAYGTAVKLVPPSETS